MTATDDMLPHDTNVVTSPAGSRCGFVALIGEPNAGKSSLLNRMVGAKVSIVTHKVQTTRTRIRGLTTEGTTQIIFVDTPGLFRPRRRLDRAMVAAAWTGAAEADIVVLLIEAHRGITSGVESILAEIADKLPQSITLVLAINKIDKVRRDSLLALIAEMNKRRHFERTFLISAQRGDGIADLRRWLANALPEGPWHFPEDQIADAPIHLLAAEITREKLTLRLHDELPYQLTVEGEKWEDRPDGSTVIHQIIYVAREGHKPIVLGKGGQTIREIGSQARADIAALIDRPVHLFLNVSVRPNWLDENERFREMGLDPTE